MTQNQLRTRAVITIRFETIMAVSQFPPVEPSSRRRNSPASGRGSALDQMILTIHSWDQL